MTYMFLMKHGGNVYIIKILRGGKCNETGICIPQILKENARQKNNDFCYMYA